MYPSPKGSSGGKHVSWHVSQSDVGRLEEAPTLFALPWMIQCDRLLIPTFGRVLGYLLWKALLSSGFVRPRISNLAVKEQNMEASGRFASRGPGASSIAGQTESEWKSGVPAPCHILWPFATGIDRVAWWRVGHGGSAGASAHRHLLQYKAWRSGNLTVNSLGSPSVGGRKQQQTTQTLQPSLPTSHPTTCSQSPRGLPGTVSTSNSTTTNSRQPPHILLPPTTCSGPRQRQQHTTATHLPCPPHQRPQTPQQPFQPRNSPSTTTLPTPPPTGTATTDH